MLLRSIRLRKNFMNAPLDEEQAAPWTRTRNEAAEPATSPLATTRAMILLVSFARRSAEPIRARLRMVEV